jgi:molybdopterin/thiamine biosynthesis adenylyltransferase
MDAASPRPFAAAVIGAGVIGSHLVRTLARAPFVRRIAVVDPGIFDASNTLQAITPADVGRNKAEAVAAHARAIRPGLEVAAHPAAVEDIPLGVLRHVDLIFACLDSKGARGAVGERACLVRVPLIDGGVRGADACLARVSIYVPGVESPCPQCAFSEADYDDQARYCCDGRAESPSPTRSHPGLGDLTAAMMILEAGKLIGAVPGSAFAGHEIVLDLGSQRHYRSSLGKRNPSCRFAEHAGWDVHELRVNLARTTLRDLFGAAGAWIRNALPLALSVPGALFVDTVACSICGKSRRLQRLRSRLVLEDRTCACGAKLRLGAADFHEWLTATGPFAAELTRSLDALGLRHFDIVTVRAGDAEMHFELNEEA